MFGETSPRVLVTYYSVSGNTARVARDIARRMGADVESLRDPDHGVGFSGYLKAVVDAIRGRTGRIGPLRFDPRDYALTVIGTPVWARHMTPAVRAYLRRSAADLQRVAFFVTSGDTDPDDIVSAMEALAGHQAIAFTGFNAAELADQNAYEAKLESFVQALRSWPASHGAREGAVLQTR